MCGGSDDDMAVPKRKVWMHPDDVIFVMSLKREELGRTEYLDGFADTSSTSSTASGLVDDVEEGGE